MDTMETEAAPQAPPELAKLAFPWPELKGTDWKVISGRFSQFKLSNSSASFRRIELDSLLKDLIGKSYPCLKHLTNAFFGAPLELMIKAVIDAPNTFPDGQYCTRGMQSCSISLTKRQAYTICTLSFFNLFPWYNYNAMFFGAELTRCMGNYYERVAKETEKDPNWFSQMITIERRVLGSTVAIPEWKTSDAKICGLKIKAQRKGIEDFRHSYQVNFADPHPGGTLPSSHGDIVQEEILFAIYPELFIAPLLVPRIGKSEAIIVSGVTRTNKYKGYQHTFDFDGDYTKDNNLISIIFMDALPGGIRDKTTLKRDLNKAYLGFSCDTHGLSIATGHWGCGAFGGNKSLNSIVQLIAAAQAGRDLKYATYDRTIPGLQDFYDKMISMNATVGEIYLGLEHAVKNGYGDYFKRVLETIKTNRLAAVETKEAAL